MKQIDRYIPLKSVVSAADLNAIVAELVRRGALTVSPPLTLADMRGGPMIRLPKVPELYPALIQEDAGDWGAIEAVLVTYDGAGAIVEGDTVHIRVPNVHDEGGRAWDQFVPFLREDMLVFVIEAPHDARDIVETSAVAEVTTRLLALPQFVPAVWHIVTAIGTAFATYEDTHVSGSIAVDRAIRIVKHRRDGAGLHRVTCVAGNYVDPVAVSCIDAELCVRRMNGRLLWRKPYFAGQLRDAVIDTSDNVVAVGERLPDYEGEAPPPDPWFGNHYYDEDDVVMYRGIRYVCLAYHASTPLNYPPTDNWVAEEYAVVDDTGEVIRYDDEGAVQWIVSLAGDGAHGNDVVPTGVTVIGTTIYVCGEEYNAVPEHWHGHIYKFAGPTGIEQAHVDQHDYRWACIDNDGTDVYVGGEYEPTPLSRITKRAGADLAETWTITAQGETVTQLSLRDVLLWYLADRAAADVPPRVIGARLPANGAANGYGWCYYTAIAASGEGNWAHADAPGWDQERIYVATEFWRPTLWLAATSYAPQDIVRYGTAAGYDLRWRCWLATVGGDPGPDAPPDDAAHWKPYSYVDLNVPDKWEPGETYEEDDALGVGTLVRDLGLRYRCYDDDTPADESDRPKDNIPALWRAEPYQSDCAIQKILLGYFEGNPEDGWTWPTTVYWEKATREAASSIMRK